ncbi:MAG: ABC transporter substrate-binding protein [Burkholderiales bacterium]|nr:ABC transporter substrate-binding protein [Burkholderiales bacterium]
MRGWIGLCRRAIGRASALAGLALALAVGLSACDNDPWPAAAAGSNMLYTSMIENTPRHLDPTASYWSNDTAVTYQVYEPLYGYHYLKRPFELVPKTAAAVVQPRYVDKNGKPLPDDAPVDQVAESIYDVPIKHGILFQPHPCFATDAQGHHLYLHLKPGELGERRTPLDFPVQGTRELTAEDFVYALKRQATTRITAPIFSTFSQYVVGLHDYGDLVKQEDAKLQAGTDPSSLDKPFLDFRRWPLAGASAPEKYLLRIRIIGKYPQWKYWMAMTFMAPVPWEADAFYSQPGMAERGLSLDNWPVGTGPFMMTEYRKDRSYTLRRNPNYRGEPYPCHGTAADRAAGLLADCGKRTPFIDGIVSKVEREEVPRRAKFRQGFYDVEVFERNDTGMPYLVEMQDSEQVRQQYLARGFRLKRGSDVNSYFIAFNMLDPTIGQSSDPVTDERHRKLRQAISIAIDWDEYSKIFPNKAGMTAMSPIPPGIFGSREGTLAGVNPITHRVVDGKIVRRPIEDAKRLMVEAGFPNGRDAKTGRPLVLSYDYYAIPTPNRKPEIDWVVRQFAKIDIQLEVRATDNNQFQDKVRKGKYQVFWLGWNADYPDAENFLYLLTTSAGKTKYDGENTSNYANPEFDRLFVQMKSLDDGPEKQALIDKMVTIVRNDAPWTMGFFPYSSAAAQEWVHNFKSAVLIGDKGRYLRLDVPQRVADLKAWNRPVWWPIGLLLAAAVGLLALARRHLRRRERTNARGEVLA